MPKRKLVEISSKQHRALSRIRKQCEEQGDIVPSIPELVGRAISYGLPELVSEFVPAALRDYSKVNK